MKLTQEEKDTLLKKIERYRQRKNDDMFDAFYHADLDLLVALVENAEKKEVKELDEEEEQQIQRNDPSPFK